MKKIVILVLAILIIVIALLMVLLLFKNEEQIFTKKDYELDINQVKEINIDIKDKQIEVSKSKDDKIHISYFESDKEFYDISVSNDNVLSMSYATNKVPLDYISRKVQNENRKVYLQIPNSLLLSLKISTTNEDIRVLELNVLNDISLLTNGGNIIIDKINVDKDISLTAKNGNVEGTIVGGYDDYAIECKIKKGECSLPLSKENGNKKLFVDVNNGNISIDFYKL